MPVTTIEWRDGLVRMIDQTRLPNELVYLDIDSVDTLAEAIKSLRVRGAPAIGVAAAFGILLGVQHLPDDDREAFLQQLDETAAQLRATRPTAVNLGWAIDRMLLVTAQHRERPVAEIKQALLAEALRLWQEDRRINRQIGEHGDTLIPANAQIMTHCNTGALATVDYGTALGVVFRAHAGGKKVRVWVDETRPLLQGARLNMWELQQEGIDATLITDSTAAFVMQKQHIDLCIVGADRIARNGDTANKIGTYSLAVAAKHHGVPFYVAAPISTIDASLPTGADIPIEERAAGEITDGFGRRTAPEKSAVFAPAFDITPHTLITAIITEAGVLYPPFEAQIVRVTKNS